jgi:Zn-dependent protease with chaperone function
MMTAGSGIFFDGVRSTRQDVMVDLEPHGLRVRAADGMLLAEWPYDELETVSPPDRPLRVGRIGSALLARLEIGDPELAAVIDERSLPVDRSGGSERRLRARVILWTFAATASLLIVAVFGLPRIAMRLTPLVPYSLERALSVPIDAQIRANLAKERTGTAFECGHAALENDGRAAFDKLVHRLETAASLPIPLDVRVVRRPEANAIALPGGRVYVFQGLIEKASTPDELAGVIAHEIGHVAHRDGTRTLLESAGLSLLFGMLLGDFVGGGAVVLAAQTLLQTSYTREVETAADAYAVELMTSIGGDPRALGGFLLRIAGTAMAPSLGERRPVVAESEWAALKRICSDS